MKRRVCGLHRDGSCGGLAWLGLIQAACVTLVDLLENGQKHRGWWLNQHLEKLSLRGLRKQEPRYVGTQQENILHCELSLTSELAVGRLLERGAWLQGSKFYWEVTSLSAIAFPESPSVTVRWVADCSPVLHGTPSLHTVTPTHPSPQPP